MTQRSESLPLSEAASAGPPLREAAASALDGLHWLLERATIYPPGHPEVERARDRTMDLLRAALARRAPLVIGASRGGLRLDRLPLDSLRCCSLGAMLFELDVVEMEIGADVQPDEVLVLARDLARLRATGGRDAARRELADGGPWPNVRVGLIDYASLRVDSGAQERPVGENPEQLWAALSQTILAPPDSPRTVAPEQLAELLGDEILSYESVGAGGLSRQLQRLLRDVEELPPGARRDAHARIARFLTALPRALREELLRIQAPDTGGDDAALRPELVAATFFFGAIRHAERPPEGAVALMNQLIRTSSLDSSERARLDELMQQALAGEATETELDRLGDAVQECFRNREDVHANPEDYDDFIDALARAGAARTDPDITWRELYGDPADAAGARVHAAEIAARQLEGLGADEAGEGIVRFLAGSADRMVETGRFDVLEAAVDAAERYAAEAETCEAGRDAASRFVNESTGPSAVRRVLDRIPRDAPVPDGALAIVRRAGGRGVDAIVAVLEAGAAPAVAAPLQEILAEQPPELILRHAADCAARGWRALRPLFPVVRRLGGPDAHEFLVRLLRHEDETVRRQALSALDEEAGSGWMEEALGPLLRDPSPRIVRAALRKLGGCSGSGPVEMLGAFVLGRVGATKVTPPLELRLLAVRVLTLRGADGWSRLRDCLARLGWRLRADDVELGRAIVAALRRHPDPDGSPAARRRWRWSPAGLFGFLVTRGHGRAEQVHW